MDGMQKIGFVSIILLIGLFSLQLGLQKVNYLKAETRTEPLRIETEPVDYMEDLQNYDGPLIYPIDTIRKYYLDPKERKHIL